jgi:ATP synthase subunit 6
MFIFDPLEQFEILSLIPLRFANYDFSFNNSAFILLIAFLGFSIIISSLRSTDTNFFIVPNRWQIIIEILYLAISNMLKDNLGYLKGSNYLPFIFTLFIYVLASNLIGLVPYSFTPTSHLIVTFSLALIVFIAVNRIGILTHGFGYFAIFYPPKTALILGLLLVPIEFVSHLFKPISLGVRLFANLMAGHTLLKVIGGFSWTMVNSDGFLLYLHIIPLIILTLLVGLELGVALIQSYVFTILSCIYLTDSINLH